MFGFFSIFKKKCNHCGSTNLKKTVEDMKGYGTKVVATTYHCKDCNAESRKTKVYKRGEQ